MVVFSWLASNIGWVIFVFLPVALLAGYVKRIDHHEFTWQEFGLSLIVAAIMSGGAIAAGLFSEISDINIINGSIFNKSRDDGSYTTCNGTDDKGNCTGYTTHYTVDWRVHGTFGTLDRPYRDAVTVGHYDSTSRSSRDNRPDPTPYVQATIGEPMSIGAPFRNYVKGAPFSLYNNAGPSTMPIPSYPAVEGYYQFMRVINVDSSLTTFDIVELDNMLDQELKTMGPFKQVNPIVIFTEIDDPTYRYELERTWIGGKKNDAIIVIGLNGTEITWASGFTYANSMGNEGFQINIGRNIRELGTISNTELTQIIKDTINSDFTRISETEFSYLAFEITPSWWVIVIAMILTFGTSLFIIHKLRTNNERSHSGSRRFR